MTKKAKRKGGKWISVLKRRAIYFRDGHVCCYCGRDEQTIIAECDRNWDMLSLDHIKAHVDGGNNEANNLITCCRSCNSSRGSKSVLEFAAYKEMEQDKKFQLAMKVTSIVCTNDGRSKKKNHLHTKGYYELAQKYLDNKET